MIYGNDDLEIGYVEIKIQGQMKVSESIITVIDIFI